MGEISSTFENVSGEHALYEPGRTALDSDGVDVAKVKCRLLASLIVSPIMRQSLGAPSNGNVECSRYRLVTRSITLRLSVVPW